MGLAAFCICMHSTALMERQDSRHRTRVVYLVRRDLASTPARHDAFAARCGGGAVEQPVDFDMHEMGMLLTIGVNLEAINPATNVQDEAAEVKEQLGGTSIYLVGMMGSGKSTVGKLLSAALGYYFFDSDSLVRTRCFFLDLFQSVSVWSERPCL